MNPTDISKILDILVERVGPMGQATWETMLRQVQIGAALLRAWGLALCVIVLLLAGLGGMICRAESRKEYNQDTSPGCLCFVIAFFFAIIAAVLFTDAYQRFSNPAYYAIQLLMGR